MGADNEKKKESGIKNELIQKENEKKDDEEDVRLYFIKSIYKNKSKEKVSDKDNKTKNEKEENESSKEEENENSKEEENEKSKGEENDKSKEENERSKEEENDKSKEENDKSKEENDKSKEENDKSKEENEESKDEENEKNKEEEQENQKVNEMNSNDTQSEDKRNKKEENIKEENNNNKIKNNSNILTITKSKVNKSSSTENLSMNNNQKPQFNFEVGEIRQKDIFENSKEQNNIIQVTRFNKKKCCYKCGTTNLDESLSIMFTCNHISCFNCIIKDLMILRFKNIENKNKIQFNCSCLIGSSPQFDFNEFLERIKRINNKKNDKSNCKEHNSIGIKYCKDCEMWLCDECMKIHCIFNNNHTLLDKEVPIKSKCKIHNNYTEYYCLKCNEEICPLCFSKNGNHSEHKSLKFEKFLNLAHEIKSKLKYKTYDECLLNLEKIKEKNNSDKSKKLEEFGENINNLINKLKIIKENYITKINSQIQYLNQIIEIMKESYKYFYLILSNEKQDYNNINFIRQISEIYDIKTEYYNNNSDISKVINIFNNLLSNEELFSYNIITKEIPYQFSFKSEKIFQKKYKILRNNSGLTVRTKYSKDQLKYKSIKYFKNLKIRTGTIYSIIKINS